MSGRESKSLAEETYPEYMVGQSNDTTYIKSLKL
jgi:hypothetical protein